MIRIALVDDQAIMIQGLSMILSSVDTFEIVATGSNGLEAISICEIDKPDILLMDIRMPELDGVEATKQIMVSNTHTKIIILTTFNDDEYIFDSLKGGASGYLLKDATPDEIISGIHTVYNGGTLINPESATKMVEHLKDQQTIKTVVDERIEDLTSRELDICHQLAKGKNNKEISALLYISEGTVKNNMTRILDKLDLRDRTQLALFSVKNNL